MNIPEPYILLHIFLDQPQIEIAWTPAWVVAEVQGCCQLINSALPVPAVQSDVLQNIHEAADDWGWNCKM